MTKLFTYASWSAYSKWGTGMPNRPEFRSVSGIIGPPFETSPGDPTVYPKYGQNQSLCQYFIQAAKNNGAWAAPYLTCDWSDFTQVVNNSLSTFVASVKNLLQRNFGTSSNPLYFSGFVLDPESGSDKTSMDKVVIALYNALNPIGKWAAITGHYGQVANYPQDISVDVLNNYCLFASPLCYDINGWSDNFARLETTLAIVQKWLTAGYRADKIIPGIPFYGELSTNRSTNLRLDWAVDYGGAIYDPSTDSFVVPSGFTVSGNSYPAGTYIIGAPAPKYQAFEELGLMGMAPFVIEYDYPISNSRSMMAAIEAVMGGGPSTYTLTITASSGGTTNPAPGSYSVDAGDQVVITAIPNSGYHFKNWSNGSTNPTISLTINSDTSIAATFEADSGGYTYNLSVIITGSGTVRIQLASDGTLVGELSQSGTIGYNSAVQVKPVATPAAGYTFEHWLLDGKIYTVLNSFTFGTRTIEAVFTGGGGGGGFVSGSVHSAKVNIAILPAGVPFQMRVWLGINESIPAAQSPLVDFTSTGISQEITCTLTMPAPGTYQVYVDILAGGVLLKGYVDTDTITVI